jgi:chemotaxis protein CheX
MARYDQDIDETVQTVWGAVLELALQRVTEGTLPTGAVISGIVLLEGDFEGAVEVSCMYPLAERMAQAMFHEQTPPTTSDVSDALGEVSNMIAGNLKSALPGTNNIGLPIVASGTDYRLSMPGSEQIGRVSYVSDGDSLQVTLLRQSGSS